MGSVGVDGVGGFRWWLVWWPRIIGVDGGVSKDGDGGSAGSAQRERTHSGVSRSDGNGAGAAQSEPSGRDVSASVGVQAAIVMTKDSWRESEITTTVGFRWSVKLGTVVMSAEEESVRVDH